MDKYDILLSKTQGDFEGFIYDCDGTLIDNMQAHKESYRRAVKKFGADLDVTIIDELSGWPIVEVAKEIINRYHLDADPVQLANLKNDIFDEELVAEGEPIAFVVKHLKAHVGKVKIGVVSGGIRRTVTHTLEILGIIDDVEAMVCAGETERGKPFPDPFLKVAEALNVNPHKCIVFEDGKAGTDGAEAAGMKWVRVDQI